MKRKASVLLVLFMIVLNVICSGMGPVAMAAANAVPESDDEPVELLYWILGGAGGLREKYFQETVDAYMELHPNVNITVELEIGNQTERAQKLYTMLVSGTGPDVFHCNGPHIHDYGSNDLIHALDGMPGIEEAKSSFYDAVLEDCSQDGILYGLPIRSNSVELYWNKDHFREVGLDPEKPPKTWDEFREYAIKLTKRDENGNITRYGAYPGFHSDVQQCGHFWYSMFFNAGGEFVTDGKVTFNSDAAIKSINYWNDLVNVLKVSPPDDIKNSFENGLYSMKVSGEWEIVLFEQVEGLDFGFTRMPEWEEDSNMPVAGLGGQYLAIPAYVSGRKLDYALDFMLFSASRDEQLRYVNGKIGTSGRNDILDDPFFETETGQMYMTAIQDLAHTKIEYAPNFVEMSNILGNALQEIILTDSDPKATLDAAAAKYQAVYDKEMTR